MVRLMNCRMNNLRIAPTGWLVGGVTYLYRRKITIPFTRVSGNLTDFPILVRLTGTTSNWLPNTSYAIDAVVKPTTDNNRYYRCKVAGTSGSSEPTWLTTLGETQTDSGATWVCTTNTSFDFAKSNANGYDIRFTQSDGETLLNYDRERHTQSSGLAEYHIKVPTVSNTVNTDIYLYYRPTSTADGQNKNATWDANFKGVWHLNETSGTVFDSTVNANNGTPYNGVTQDVEGKIDGADSFDGSNDYVNVPDKDSIDFVGPQTLSLWIKTNSTLDNMRVLSNEPSWASTITLILYNGVVLYRRGNCSNAEWTALTITDIRNNEWHYIVAIDTGTKVIVYVDEVKEYDAVPTGYFTPTVTSQSLHIGNVGYSSDLPFNGILDEVRISSAVRSPGWITTEYNNQNSPST